MAEWVHLAACKHHPLSTFYPETPYGGEIAKAICADCPVRVECLLFAIETRQEHGIWAGMTTRERQAFEDKKAREKRSVSGTMSGSQRW